MLPFHYSMLQYPSNCLPETLLAFQSKYINNTSEGWVKLPIRHCFLNLTSVPNGLLPSTCPTACPPVPAPGTTSIYSVPLLNVLPIQQVVQYTTHRKLIGQKLQFDFVVARPRSAQLLWIITTLHCWSIGFISTNTTLHKSGLTACISSRITTVIHVDENIE